MNNDHQNTFVRIAISGKRFICSPRLPDVTKSSLFISGASGMAGNIMFALAGGSLKDVLIVGGGLFSLSANVTQMAEKGIRRAINISEQQVVKSSATQFGFSGLCYSGAFLVNHEPASIAMAGVSSMAGSMATIFLPEKKGWMLPRTAGGILYFTATANAWVAAWNLHNPYLAVGALLSTISCVAFTRSGKKLLHSPAP